MMAPEKTATKLAIAALLSLAVVVTAMVIFLSRDLPGVSTEPLSYPATDFKLVFGTGHPNEERMVVDGFANGYALLSSGPLSIQADAFRILRYTWLPPEMPQEAAFLKASPASKRKQSPTYCGA